MILRRYIHREILEKLGWIIGLLLLIITSNLFVRYLADAAAGALPTDLIFRMVLVKILATLPKLMPVAIFLAVILGLSRLARDKELMIVSVSGGAHRFQFVSIFQFSLLFAALVFVTSFFISPWAMKKTEELKARVEIEADTVVVKPGKFNEFSKGNQIVYIEQISNDGKSMENVFLQDLRGERLSILNSNSAQYKVTEPASDKYILFEDGKRYVGYPGGLDYRIIKYKTYAVLVEQKKEDIKYVKLESLPTLTLLASDNPRHQAELQWRISFVLSSLLLPMLAFALNRYSFSEQKYLPVFVGVLIYIIYSNMLSISKTLLKRDEITSSVGLWWVHAVLVALIALVFLLARAKRLSSRGGRRRYQSTEA